MSLVEDREETGTKPGFRKKFKGRVEVLATDNKVRRLAQLGYAARGLLYLIFGLTFAVATVRTGDRPRGVSSSLDKLIEWPFGRIAVGLVAIGLFGYILRRFVQIWAAPDAGKRPPLLLRFGRRVSYAMSGLANIGITLTALFLTLGLTVSEQNRALISRLPYELPGGLPEAFLVLVGLGFIGYAGFEFYMAISRRFTIDLQFEGKRKGIERFTLVCGIIGYAGRGVAFLAAGAFLVYLASVYDELGRSGIRNFLAAFEAQQYGYVVVLTISFGLIAYGLYLLLAAWYLRMIATW
jgi:hypothetical protein